MFTTMQNFNKDGKSVYEATNSFGRDDISQYTDDYKAFYGTKMHKFNVNNYDD